MKLILLSITVLFSSVFAEAQSLSPDKIDKNEREYFDFLIGKWQILEKKTMEGIETGGRDTYSFQKALNGNVIIAEWYFNRGTNAEPNYTEGLYYSAYDNLTNVWSFYYISALSSQYFQGKKKNGQWYFYRDFTIEGNSFLQRQSWRLKNDTTLIRTIENSSDKGKTWNKVYVVTLRKEQ